MLCLITVYNTVQLSDYNTSVLVLTFITVTLLVGSLILMAAWLSGNGVAHIIEVTLRRARLVSGWVTAKFESRSHCLGM